MLWVKTVCKCDIDPLSLDKVVCKCDVDLLSLDKAVCNCETDVLSLDRLFVSVTYTSLIGQAYL